MAEVNDAPNDDLRGDLARAMIGAFDGAAPEPIDQDSSPPPDEAPETQTAEESARDDVGRFAKVKRETLSLKEKPPGDASSPTDAASQAAPLAASQKTEIPPPLDWKGEEKLLWKNVPNALKQKYSDDIKAARDAAGTAAPLMQAIGNDRDMLAREGGGSVEGGVRRLLDLSNFALANPIDFVRTFIQQRGLNPAQIFGQGQQGEGPQQPQPEMHPQFQHLHQRLDAFESQQRQQAHSATLATIEAFAADPDHVYFNDVSDDMLAFIKDNPAIGLKGAYDRAVWANPATRAQMMLAQQQTPSNPAAVDAARRAKSANLNGSPMPGASSQQAGQNEDLRTTIERNYLAQMGGQRV